MADLYCQGLTAPIRLPDSGLGRILADFLSGWPFELRPADPGRSPVISISVPSEIQVEQEAGEPLSGYRIEAPWLPEPLVENNLTRLLCSLTVDLATACLQADPELIGLHAAAVDLGGQAALFPNVNRAGKSLLTAALMANGHTSYGDDLIALTTEGRVRSFGLPPRLRLPLPHLPQSIRDFIQDHLTLADRHYGFLKVRGAGQAVFGQESGIGAVVILDRRKSGPADLAPLDRETGLKYLTNRCLLLNPGQALAALELGQKITGQAASWSLTYSDLQGGLEAVQKVFKPRLTRPSGTKQATSAASAPANPEPPADRVSGTLPRPVSNRLYVRNESVVVREEGGALFLVEETSGLIFHLNQTGCLVWNLLARPVTTTEVIGWMARAFPGISRARITKDIETLFEDLRAEGLIQPLPRKRRRKSRANAQ